MIRNINKIIGFLLLSILIIFGCNTDTDNNLKFSFKGVFSNANHEIVRLYNLNSGSPVLIDSTEINNAGVFSFHTPISENGFYKLQFPKNYVLLIVDTTSQIEWHGDINNLYSDNTIIRGSIPTVSAWRLEQLRIKRNHKVDSIGKVLLNSQNLPDFNSIKKEIDSIFNVIFSAHKQDVKNFIDTTLYHFACYWALDQNIGNVKVIDTKTDFHYYEKVDSVMQKLDKNFIHSQSLHAWIAKQNRQKFEKQLKEKRLKTGKIAPELVLNDIDETPQYLSNQKGKVVLLYFWDSANKTCRKEHKNMISFYNKQQKDNFEIYAVCLDVKYISFLDVVKHDKLPWINVLGNKLTIELYNLEQLPETYILDTNGAIVEKHIWGNEMYQKLDSIIEKRF